MRKPDIAIPSQPIVRRPEAKPVSLSDLLPKEARRAEQTPKENQRQNVDLPELRRLIRETVAKKQEPVEQAPKANPDSQPSGNSGVIKPGDSIKF
jgi:hypothetical protein